MNVRTRRWLARASFALMLAAVALVLAVAGWRSLTLVAFAVIGACAVLAGAYWFLANRGALRWIALVLVVAAPVLILLAFAHARLLWVAVAAVALMVLAAGIGRTALSTGGQDAVMPAGPAARPLRPFLIMNPRSGGGKVIKFALKDKAEMLGAEVVLLDGPGIVDVAALARQAVADGADLLGVAGGDGTQALVAGIAAEHGLPFLVISAGTRNHFALDLGLDREDPAAGLNALTDGEELRVDLGIIGGRTFVNNASFGAYAEVVRSPAYRDDKRGTTLQMLPDPRRHRRRDGHAPDTGPLHHPATSAFCRRAEGTSRSSLPQGSPQMAAAPATRLLPLPARRRALSRAAGQELSPQAQARSRGQCCSAEPG